MLSAGLLSVNFSPCLNHKHALNNDHVLLQFIVGCCWYKWPYFDILSFFFVFCFYLFLKYTYKDYTTVSASTWKLHPLKLSFGGVNLERISDLKQACACHPGKINYWESDSTILGHHISFPFIPPSHSPYKYSFALPKVLLRHPILGGEEAGCCDE